MSYNLTEDSICLKLGKIYGIERGLDCAPNILMFQWRYEYNGAWLTKRVKGQYEADFVYITKSKYLHEIEVKISIADFRNDQQKKLFHTSPLVKAFSYCLPTEVYWKHKDEIDSVCKSKGAGLIIVDYGIRTILKSKQREDVQALTDTEYVRYLKLFAKKWVRKR